LLQRKTEHTHTHTGSPFTYTGMHTNQQMDESITVNNKT